MHYKLLILDVDGVLVKSKGGSISKKVVQVIRKVKDKIFVSLCTGRTHRDLRQILDVLDIHNSYHVIESGAKVLNPSGEEENIKEVPLSDVRSIVETAENTPAGYGFCVNGKWINKIDEIGNGQVTTVSLHSHHQAQTQTILKAIKPVYEKYHVAVGSHWEIPEGNFILITHPQASKGDAFRYIQEKLSINKKETIAIGDMPNDIPLFELSGLKVAMGNADPQLKEMADVVAPSIDDDGVVFVVEKYCN